MKTFVVGYISFFDNELKLERIEALEWRHAVIRHSKFGDWTDMFTEKELQALDESSFKALCFDSDFMMAWLEI